MATFEEVFEKACVEKEIPGAVLVATDKTGSFKYAKAFGSRSLGEPEEPLALDTMMWTASCTKLQTSIACLQCIEKGLFTLDDDVTKWLHEFRDSEIITGFEDGKPQMKKATKAMTLRHLLTHSSGLAYDVFDPKLMAWRASRGEKLSRGKTIPDKYTLPLLYEPGEWWSYSVGIDWAGKLLERALNNGQSLGDYLNEHVWKPLGINSMTFHLRDRPDLQERMAVMSQRSPETGKAVHSGEDLMGEVVDDFGGAGCYCCAPEYLKILQSILANDGKLLKPETVTDIMFQPHLSKKSQAGLMKTTADPAWQNALGGLPVDAGKDWGIGGLLTLADLPGTRKSGTMTWGGLPNLTWFIDPTSGLCGLTAMQMTPPGDAKAVELIHVYERGLYAKYQNFKPQL
ncbi:MAG: hypothetical protein MMC33_010493 [Icmadophila ericetorum]|nr:hypothetical protein [Icmadophila ericetorum]